MSGQPTGGEASSGGLLPMNQPKAIMTGSEANQTGLGKK
jgi:hypothetical protein